MEAVRCAERTGASSMSIPAAPALSSSERLAIHELISLYGHLVDQRQFSRLGSIFTDDAVFDLSGYDGSCYRGLPAIQAMMLASSEHPLAHHATNVVVLTQLDGIEVISKGIGVGEGGRVGSVTYTDRLVFTPLGWRIRERRCELRRPEGIPDPT
jgi:SnoaL-like domain